LLGTAQNTRGWDKKLIIIGEIDYSSITRIMIKRALITLKALNFFTGLSLINFRVKLLFFPAVTILALLLLLAALFIACYKCPTLPVLAQIGFIPHHVWLPSEILVVMRIYTLCLIMFMIIRAPFSFKPINVELDYLPPLFDQPHQPHLYLLYRVRKRAILPVLAIRNLIRIKMTELSLILVLVIKAFDTVMRSTAFITFGAFLGVGEFAELGGVEGVEATRVFKGVGKVTGLVVVGGREVGTGKTLEGREGEVAERGGWFKGAVVDPCNYYKVPIRSVRLNDDRCLLVST